jgi:hypothetical protein
VDIPDDDCDPVAQTSECGELGYCSVVLLHAPPDPVFGVRCLEFEDDVELLPLGSECDVSLTTSQCSPGSVCDIVRIPNVCRQMCELSTGRGCDPNGSEPYCNYYKEASASVGVGVCRASCE